MCISTYRSKHDAENEPAEGPDDDGGRRSVRGQAGQGPERAQEHPQEPRLQELRLPACRANIRERENSCYTSPISHPFTSFKHPRRKRNKQTKPPKQNQPTTSNKPKNPPQTHTHKTTSKPNQTNKSPPNL